MKPPSPPLLRRASFWVVLTVVMLLLATAGMGFLVQIPLKLALGWITFIEERLPLVTVNGDGVALAVFLLGLFLAGAHLLLRKLSRHFPNALPPWRWRFSLGGGLALFLLFIAGMATIGLAHQVGWLLSGRQPFLYDPYLVRVQVAMAIEASAPVRVGWVGLVSEKGRLPERDEEVNALLPPPQSWPRSVQFLGVSKEGVITIRLSERVPFLADREIKYLPMGRIDGASLWEWKCVPDKEIERKFLPSSCRDQEIERP